MPSRGRMFSISPGADGSWRLEYRLWVREGLSGVVTLGIYTDRADALTGFHDERVREARKARTD